MRFTFLSVFIPALVQSAALGSIGSGPHTTSVENREVHTSANGLLERQIRGHNSTFEFELLEPETNASYSFTFELAVPTQATPCGLTQFRLNQHFVTEEWPDIYRTDIEAREGHSGILSLTAKDSTDIPHSIVADSFTKCQRWYTKYGALSEVIIFQTTTVNVLEIDGRQTDLSFTALYDQHRGNILGIVDTFNATQDSPLPSDWSDALIEKYIPFIPPISGVGFSFNDLTILSFKKETDYLGTLEADLAELQALISAQRQRVNLLNLQSDKTREEEFSSCKKVPCRIRGLLYKITYRLRSLYLRLRLYHTGGRLPDQPQWAHAPASYDRSAMSGVQGVGQAGMTDGQVCGDWSKKKEGAESGATVVGQDGFDEPPPAYSATGPTAQPSQGESEDRGHEHKHGHRHPDRWHVFLYVLALFCCMGCLAPMAHRKCMNPRARADWQAQCEERRTMREYRTLARQRAWKRWIASWKPRSLRTEDEQRIEDYEEKRRLIQMQEGILEQAMQSEISLLTGTTRLRNAEEGQSGRVFTFTAPGAQPGSPSGPGSRSDDGGSLYEYRGRSDSGPPPSYHTVDLRPIIRVADGFRGYRPVSSVNADADADDVATVISSTNSSSSNRPAAVITPPASDVTPDSSVREISPRHSFETLRTDPSAFLP